MGTQLNILLVVGIAVAAYFWGCCNHSSRTSEEEGKIVLHYFDARWTTETIRLLLKYGGIEFEDHRVKDEWAELKPKMPFGHLPVIERNGKKAGQSIAIARYIAKKVNLAGANDWEDLEIDSIVDTLNDIKEKLSPLFKDDEDEALREKLLKETIPYYFDKLELLAKENNGHLVGQKLTWADFYFTVTYDIFTGLLEASFIESYPNLAKVRENVLNLPAVKTWLQTRPKTDF